MESSGTQSREEKGGSSINGGGPGHGPSPPSPLAAPLKVPQHYFFSPAHAPLQQKSLQYSSSLSYHLLTLTNPH